MIYAIFSYVIGGLMNQDFNLPQDLVLLISGVPGVGKTTISYELLKRYEEFRLVEETDIIREILRGYNTYISSEYKLEPDNIYPHDIFLSYDMTKQQCQIMKESILNIINRQKRKKIPTIINGVHIIPEELYLCTPHSNVLFINLYIDSMEALWKRLKHRNPEKYTTDCLPILYQTNKELNNSLQFISRNFCKAYSVNVTNLTIEETLSVIHEIFCALY